MVRAKSPKKAKTHKVDYDEDDVKAQKKVSRNSSKDTDSDEYFSPKESMNQDSSSHEDPSSYEEGDDDDFGFNSQQQAEPGNPENLFDLTPHETRQAVFHPRQNMSLILPLICVGAYVFVVTVMWKNINRVDYPKNAPMVVTILGGVIFAGLIWAWIKSLESPYALASGCGFWVSFWFVSSFVLISAAAYTFFKLKNASTSSFIMFFVWLSSLVLIYYSASCFAPGLVFTFAYLAGVTWLWAVVMRQSKNACRQWAHGMLSASPSAATGDGVAEVVADGEVKVAASGFIAKLHKFFGGKQVTDVVEPGMTEEVSEVSETAPQSVDEAFAAEVKNEALAEAGPDLFKPETGSSPMWRNRGLSDV
jgi:hypothetical protein